MGIGGAERLVVDAALTMQNRGYPVTICVGGGEMGPQFPQIVSGEIRMSTGLIDVPLHIFGHGRLPLALMGSLSAMTALTPDSPPDLIFSDVTPHVLPWAKRRTRCPILHYCHFPDLLLTPPRAGLYSLYRRPIDSLEARGMNSADLVLANSRFTADVTARTFRGLRATPEVLHPGVQCERPYVPPPDDGLVFLSVSRFDPSKNLPLLIEALAFARTLVPPDVFDRMTLVMAGHRDDRSPQNRVLLSSLHSLVARHGLSGHVEFVFSPTDDGVQALLRASTCVVYPPVAEHFGYVPLEAMAAGRPVVAVDNGGPKETIRDGQTGLLRPPNVESFGHAMAELAMNPALAAAMGLNGRTHVRQHFSLDAFGDRLEGFVTRLTRPAGVPLKSEAPRDGF